MSVAQLDLTHRSVLEKQMPDPSPGTRSLKRMGTSDVLRSVHT